MYVGEFTSTREVLIIQLDFIKKLWLKFYSEASLWDCSHNLFLHLWMLVKDKLSIPVEQLTIHKNFGIRT